MKTIDYRWCIFVLFCVALTLDMVGQPANPEPVLPPGFDPNTGKLPPLRRTAEHSLVRNLSLVFKHYVEKTGRAPRNWDELERVFGEGVWDSRDQWNNIKRRFAFVTTEGRVATHEDGLLEGTLLLAPLYSIRDPRSEEEGRFTVWKLSNGLVFATWSTESELQTFSKWSEVAAKLEVAKAAVAKMPPLVIGSAQVPPPRSKEPVRVAPATPLPGTVDAQRSSSTRERGASMWPWWVCGMLTVIMIIIITLGLKRRT